MPLTWPYTPYLAVFNTGKCNTLLLCRLSEITR